MKIRIVLLSALVLAFGSIGYAQSRTKSIAPESLVKSLYAAHQNQKTDPFQQSQNRVLLDKYFTGELAELLWKDGVQAKGEVGALDFDPLYNAQDTQITAFKIGKPMYGEGNLEVADVPVTFKNIGQEVTVLFRLERNSRKVWKISDIYYPANAESNSSLKGILTAALKGSAGNAMRAFDSSAGKTDVMLATAEEKQELFELIRQDKGFTEDLKIFTDSPAEADKLAQEWGQSLVVRKLDLNQDGQPEYVAVIENGVACGALANCPHWIYRKQGDGYERLLGRTNARSIVLEKSSTNGYRDLRDSGGSTAWEDGYDIIKYDGSKYRATDCFTRKNQPGRPAKVKRVQCEPAKS